MSKDTPSTPANETGKLSGSAAITVGCKLPHGLVCELGKPGTESYRRHVLIGANGGRDGRGIRAGGYGLTTVPEDFMQAWLKKNAGLDFVKSGAIFIHGSLEHARGHAEANAELVTGFEGLNPSKPPKGIEVDRLHMEQGLREATHAAQASGMR